MLAKVNRVLATQIGRRCLHLSYAFGGHRSRVIGRSAVLVRDRVQAFAGARIAWWVDVYRQPILRVCLCKECWKTGSWRHCRSVTIASSLVDSARAAFRSLSVFERFDISSFGTSHHRTWCRLAINRMCLSFGLGPSTLRRVMSVFPVPSCDWSGVDPSHSPGERRQPCARAMLIFSASLHFHRVISTSMSGNFPPCPIRS